MWISNLKSRSIVSTLLIASSSATSSLFPDIPCLIACHPLLLNQGHLHTYRFCDGVWIFHLEQAEYKPDTRTGEQLEIGSVKIIASDSSL